MYPMFIAALFTIAKIWKQPKCPLIDEWIQKMWYIYTTEYYTSIKKNEILLLATPWMDLQYIMLSETCQTAKDILYDFTYMWYLKKKKNKHNKTETESQIQRTNRWQYGEGD